MRFFEHCKKQRSIDAGRRITYYGSRPEWTDGLSPGSFKPGNLKSRALGGKGKIFSAPANDYISAVLE